MCVIRRRELLRTQLLLLPAPCLQWYVNVIDVLDIYIMKCDVSLYCACVVCECVLFIASEVCMRLHL